LKEITNRENSQYFCQTLPDEKNNTTNLSSIANKLSISKINTTNLNDFKVFNSMDTSFTKTFSPKNYNSKNINNAFNMNQFQLYNASWSKFPKISDKYSGIATILKKDINEAIKKEKEKELEIDSIQKFSSLSNNVLINPSSISTNNNKLIILPDKRKEEIKDKKVQKLNLNDILSANTNKEE